MTVNLPIGAVTLIAVTLILKPTPPFKKNLTPKQKILQLDPLGTLFLLPCLICLLLALQWGGTSLAWSNGKIIALLVLFALLAISFITVQIFRQETAQIPASIVENRSMLAGGFFIFALAGSMIIGLTEALVAGYQSDLHVLGDGFGDVAPYAVMIVVLLVRPTGLFGAKGAARV